jgi:hypothetical protein
MSDCHPRIAGSVCNTAEQAAESGIRVTNSLKYSVLGFLPFYLYSQLLSLQIRTLETYSIQRILPLPVPSNSFAQTRCCTTIYNLISFDTKRYNIVLSYLDCFSI